MAGNHELIDRVARLVAELQDAVQLLDESAAAELGLNLTDLRCVRQIVQEGPRSASQLADSTGLTRAAISAALDRLEKANVATRVPDTTDRRRTLVEPTDHARQQVARIWGPIERDGRQELANYSEGRNYGSSSTSWQRPSIFTTTTPATSGNRRSAHEGPVVSPVNEPLTKPEERKPPEVSIWGRPLVVG